MLSPAAFKYLVRGVTVGGTTGSIPYDWDAENQRVLYVASWKRKLLYGIHNAVYCAYLIYCWVRWIQVAFYWESPTSPMAMGTLYVALMYNVATAIQWSIVSNYGEHQTWLNDLLELMNRFQGKQGSNEEDKLEFECYRTCRSYMITGCTIFCLDTLSCLALPVAPFFLTSLLPNPMERTLLELLPYVSIHIYIWIHQWATIFTYFNFTLCYLAGISNILSELRHNQATTKRQRLKKDPESFAKGYDRLQRTHGHYNKLWSISNALFEIICLSGSTLAYYGGVRLPGARGVQQGVVALFITLCVVTIFARMGDTFELSSEVLHSWKKKAHGNVWFKKYLRSVKPIGVYVGGFFYADRGIKLTILAIILNNTLSLLLST